MKERLSQARELAGKLFKRPWAVVLLAVFIVVLLVVTRPRLEPVVLEERVWPVEVVTARRADVQPTLNLFGEVVAGRRSELRALVPGRIVATGENFDEGARVSAGELLVQIDPFDYRNDLAEQKALFVESEAELTTAQRELKRVRELYGENNVSEQSLDDARLAVEQQTAALEQRRISLARAEKALQDTRLTAPYNGVLHAVSADVGKQLSVNDQVAEIIDTAGLEVRFTLSNAQFGRILESGEPIRGRPVGVTWKIGNNTLRFDATLERIGAEIDSTSGGVEMYAVIDTDDDTPLRPGAFVWATMADKLYKNVFQAPESALYGDGTVYIVRDGRMAARRIKVQGYDGETLLFTPLAGEVINDGDQIVTTQLREGGAGIRVEIRE